MKRYLTCQPMWAGIIFGAWLMMLVVLDIQYRRNVMQPHFLPVASVLGVQAVAGGVLLAGGAWRLVRGPGRVRAAGWVLLGTCPLWISSTYLSYVYCKIGNRDLSLRATGFDRFAALGGAALATLEARFRYPHRFEGRHVVMWTDRAEGGGQQVALADQYIENLLSLLGCRSKTRAFWIRGELLGLQGRYWQGIVLGSPYVESGPALEYLDRHELAHFAIEHLCAPGADPPTLFIEGWAALHSRSRAELDALRASIWRKYEE